MGWTFRFITIKDMTNAQEHLIRHLGIEKLFCVTGGSMGGMQALQWVTSYPDRVRSAIPMPRQPSIPRSKSPSTR